MNFLLYSLNKFNSITFINNLVNQTYIKALMKELQQLFSTFNLLILIDTISLKSKNLNT